MSYVANCRTRAEGIYDDPKGGLFRAAVYPRLRAHFHFHNEIGLFGDVHHATQFSINIYGKPANEPGFAHLANLFAPATVDACHAHDGNGPVPGIKTDEGDWNVRGHQSRIIPVDTEALATFVKLYDEPGTPVLQARLPALHSRELLGVLEKFAAYPKRLGDLAGEYFSLEMWHETMAQKEGTIQRDTRFPTTAAEWVLSGPHFFVGNPFYKTPRRECTQNSHYDVLDLTELPDDYLPRTNYVPACDADEYRRRTPRVPWIEEGEIVAKPVTEYFRVISRTMLSQSGERTLISAIFPPLIGHVDLGFTLLCKDSSITPLILRLFSSLPSDFFIKSTGKVHFRNWLSLIFL